MTRYFSLGQIFVAQQLLSGAAHAAQADEGLGDGRDSGSHDGVNGKVAAASLSSVGAGDETGSTSAPATPHANTAAGAPHPAGHQGPLDGTGSPVEKVNLEAAGGAGQSAVAGVQGETPNSPGAGSEGGHADPDPGHSDPGSDGQVGIHVGLPSAVDAIAAPVLGVVGDTVDLAGNVVGSATEAVADVIHLVSDVVPEVVGSIVGAVAPIVGDVVDLVATVGGSVTSAVSTVLHDLGSTADSAIANLSLTVDHTVDGITGSLSFIGDHVGSSGVISLVSDTVSNTLHTDPLFDGSKYTDLNIAMRSDVPDSIGAATESLHSTASALTDALFGDAHDSDSLDIGTDHGHGLLSTLMHDTTKGGLAELFS